MTFMKLYFSVTVVLVRDCFSRNRLLLCLSRRAYSRLHSSLIPTSCMIKSIRFRIVIGYLQLHVTFFYAGYSSWNYCYLFLLFYSCVGFGIIGIMFMIMTIISSLAPLDSSWSFFIAYEGHSCIEIHSITTSYFYFTPIIWQKNQLLKYFYLIVVVFVSLFVNYMILFSISKLHSDWI